MSNIVTTTTSSPGIDTNSIVESTTDSGVEIKRVTTSYAKVVTPGVALLSAVYQITSRVTIESDWEPFAYTGANGIVATMPSTQLNSRKTTTELLIGTPCRSASGFVWVQGGRFVESFASLQLAEILEETFTWYDNCSPRSSRIDLSQKYSPLALTIAGGFPGYLYDDGTLRADSTYNFMGIYGIGGALYRDRTDWPDSATLDEALRGVGHLVQERFYQTTPGYETFGIVDPNSQGIANINPIASLTGAPTTGSAHLPQVFEEIIMAEYDATDASGYARRMESPSLMPYPENEDELLAIAKRRIRRDMSDVLDIPHRLIPFLRVGDHVTITNHARGLVNVSAYVTAIKRTADVTNGAFRQVTTVKIPPSWI